MEGLPPSASSLEDRTGGRSQARADCHTHGEVVEDDAEDEADTGRAGIYRFVQVPAPKVTLKLSGLKKGAIKLGKRVTVTGKVTPATLAGSKVTLKVQKKKGHKWVTVKTVKRTIGHSGAYSWKYKPAKRGAYRLQVTIAKTAAHTAAKTPWRGFKVK